MLKESAEKILRKLQGKITIISDRLLYRLSLIEETRGKELKARAETTTIRINMARITTYTLDTNISSEDKLVGTDAEDSNITKNYEMSDIATYIAAETLSHPVVFTGLLEASSDGEAASLGVPINGVYQNSAQLYIRVS